MDIKTIRQKYPQYADMSDQQLADALHKKYYSDMSLSQFYDKIGFKQSSIQNSSIASNNNHTNESAVAVSSANSSDSFYTPDMVLAFVFSILLLLYVGKVIAVYIVRMLFKIVGSVIHWCQKITNGYASGAKQKTENSYSNKNGKYSNSNSNSRENQNQNRSEQGSQQHSQNQNKSSNSSASDFEERLAAIRSRSELCFEVLGLKKGATASDIKVAYKRSMSKYHPDRVTGLGEKIQQLAEEETKLINAAYQTLKRLGYC